MLDRNERPVLIAGGGIGGLAAAIALAKRGIATRVLERRPAFSEEGAGIQIGPNGTRILQQLGVDGALAPYASSPDAVQVRDAITGLALARLPLGSWIKERHGAPYWTAHRQDLHRALLDTARSHSCVALETEAEVTDVSEQGRLVAAALKNGRRIEAPCLIAADGLWSAVRTNYFRSSPPRTSGQNAYRTVVPAAKLPDGLTKNDVHIWLSERAHVVHYPVRAGAEHAFIIVLEEPHQSTGWSSQVDASFVRSRTSGLAPSLRVLVEAGSDWRMWSLNELAMPAIWTSGHVALLGDAAHPVLPFLAQGAVLALEDASVLAQELAGTTGTVPEALSRYERLRRARALRVQSASRRNGMIYHMRSGLIRTMRDQVLEKAPSALLMRQYDWLYGWQSGT